VIFDSQEHKDITLQLLDAANFPGKSLDVLFSYKQSIKGATVANPETVIIVVKPPKELTSVDEEGGTNGV